MRDLQSGLQNAGKITEAKLKEEGNQVTRNVDAKLERSKKDVQNLLAEFKNTVTLGMKRQDEDPNNYSANHFAQHDTEHFSEVQKQQVLAAMDNMKA